MPWLGINKMLLRWTRNNPTRGRKGCSWKYSQSVVPCREQQRKIHAKVLFRDIWAKEVWWISEGKEPWLLHYVELLYLFGGAGISDFNVPLSELVVGHGFIVWLELSLHNIIEPTHFMNMSYSISAILFTLNDICIWFLMHACVAILCICVWILLKFLVGLTITLDC